MTQQEDAEALAVYATHIMELEAENKQLLLDMAALRWELGQAKMVIPEYRARMAELGIKNQTPYLLWRHHDSQGTKPEVGTA